jgi:hypothetical protein
MFRTVEATIIGTIGSTESMKPQVIERTDKDGNIYKTVTFKMFAGNKESYQVNLPYNEWGQSVFKSLSAGRKVQVKGGLYHSPNAQLRGKEINAWANPTVQADSIVFMDTNLQKMGEIVFSKMEKTEIPNILKNMIVNNPECTSSEILSTLSECWRTFAIEQHNQGRTQVQSTQDVSSSIENGPI